MLSGFSVIATLFTDQGEASILEWARDHSADGRLVTTRTDITNDDSVVELESFVASYVSQHEGSQLVALVNNAGIALCGPLEVQPMSQFRRQIDVNLIGHVHVAQKLIKFLRISKGRLVNVVSIAGRAAHPSMGAYAASKFAMEAITDVQRQELAPFGISVSAIEPGFIKTPLVNNAFGELERTWDSLLPEVSRKTLSRYISLSIQQARQLYSRELESSKKSGSSVLSYAPHPCHGMLPARRIHSDFLQWLTRSSTPPPRHSLKPATRSVMTHSSSLSSSPGSLIE